MFIQNPYGRGANVSSALFNLGDSLRAMFQQEFNQRQQQRAHEALMEQKALELKRLDLAGQEQQLRNRLSLSKMNLEQQARDEEARRWDVSRQDTQDWRKDQMKLQDRRVAAEERRANAYAAAQELQKRVAENQLKMNRYLNRSMSPGAFFGMPEEHAKVMVNALGIPDREMPMQNWLELLSQNLGKVMAMKTHYSNMAAIDQFKKDYQQAGTSKGKQAVRADALAYISRMKAMKQTLQDPNAQIKAANRFADSALRSGVVSDPKAAGDAGVATVQTINQSLKSGYLDEALKYFKDPSAKGSSKKGAPRNTTATFSSATTVSTTVDPAPPVSGSEKQKIMKLMKKAKSRNVAIDINELTRRTQKGGSHAVRYLESLMGLNSQ